MATPVPKLDDPPISPAPDEESALARLRAMLAQSGGTLRIVEVGGDSIELPRSVVDVLTQVVDAFSHDQTVSIARSPQFLTLNEAAAFLGLRPAYLDHIIADGHVSVYETEGERRLRFDEALRYREEMDRTRREALRELTQQSEELGLYDIDVAGDAEGGHSAG